MADVTMNQPPEKHQVNGTPQTNGTSPTQPSAHNAWQSPGPAAFDFRSDVVTTPTPSMLLATQNTSLLDDVFAEDATTNALQSRLAALAGHADALLVLSGTMGNQIALRTLLTRPPHSVLCDHRAHILEWEAGGVASLSGALVHGVAPANGHHLTLADVARKAVRTDDVHAAPTRVISLENTLGGAILPLADCQAIAAWARAHGIAMHLDGARLWEAVAAQVARGQHGGDLARGLRAYCACFDAVSLCFSKGLGAPVGSMLVGGAALVKTARHVRKSIGGGLRQSGVVTAAARVAVEETFLGGGLVASHERAREIARAWTERGGRLAREVETNMCWFDLEHAGIGVEEFVAVGARHGVRFLGGRLVVHYQISTEAVERLARVMDEVLQPAETRNGTTNDVSREEEKAAEEIWKHDME